jgi:hypothetical protein
LGLANTRKVLRKAPRRIYSLLIICGLFTQATHTIAKNVHRRGVGWLGTNELERTWEKASVAYFKVPSENLTWTDSLDKRPKQKMVKSRRIRWAGHVARMGENRNAYRLLVGTARRKETTGKTKTYVGGQY